jgi:hypothetical protein
MDQNRNVQNPDRDKDRNRSDQGGSEDRTIGQQRDRNQGGDASRDLDDVNSRNRNQGDRSSGGGSQTNR